MRFGPPLSAAEWSTTLRELTTNAAGWPTTIAAITLVTDDLPGTDRFYRDVFKMEPVHTDGDSVVFRFGETLINLLHSEAAPELVDPAPVVGADVGVRSVLTVHVEDVDTWCATLKERGVELLNGPMDRPWGPRTASSVTPAARSGRSQADPTAPVRPSVHRERRDINRTKWRSIDGQCCDAPPQRDQTTRSRRGSMCAASSPSATPSAGYEMPSIG